MTVIEEYVKVYNQIKELEQIKDELSIKVLDEIDENSGKPIVNDLGVISMGQRSSWEYSKELQKEKDVIKAKEKLEQTNGAATLKGVSRHVIFRQPELKEPNVKEA